MSRYTISENEHLEVIVGWDPPLGTFFVQVFDNTVADDEDDCIVNVGTSQGEIPSLASLRISLEARGLPEIPPDVQTELMLDFHQKWEPPPLQRALGFNGKVDGHAA